VDESSYLICDAPSGVKSSLKEQHNPENSIASASFQPVPTISADDSISTSQFVPSSLCDAAKNSSTDIVGASSVQETNQMQVDCLVAEDSEADNNDLYLSNCRISLVGFDEKEMLRLVMMIRNGGGCRHIWLSEKLTHIVLGMPSEE
jgi:topoisomerase (DNA) II binding protein 1